MTEVINRRRFERKPCNDPVTLTFHQQSLSGVLVNYSPTGVGFSTQSDFCLKPGDQVVLNGFQSRIQVEVRWTKDSIIGLQYNEYQSSQTQVLQT